MMKPKTKKGSGRGAKVDPAMSEKIRLEVSELIRMAGCGEITLGQLCTSITAITLTRLCPPSEFEKDVNHFGAMTVWDLVKLVHTSEFPEHMKTLIKIGDVEGNNGVNGNMCVSAHYPGDVVLSIDPHEGELDYDPS